MKQRINLPLIKHKHKRIFFVFIFLCAVTAVFCFQYYNKLQTTIHEESDGYIQEISRKIGGNISQIISDNYAVLNTISSVLENSDTNTFF